MLRPVALVVALALALVLAAWASRTPAPVPASAPASAFSAERAFAHVKAIASRPHPTGSPENAAARDYLVGRFRALGLETRVQPGEAVIRWPGAGEPFASAAKVENVVAVMAGRDRTLPALAVMAHYDSVPNSPGASDDAAGVASALETARAMKAAGQPDRDVVFLITDGEEAGLIGAKAFWADDPLAKRIGAVINMDTRGDGGRAYMFETGDGNGETVARFARTAVNPSATSLSSFIYKLLPNNTDFTILKRAGLPGVNFGFIGREFGYHSWSSTPAALEQGSLQHMGEQALAAARELSDSKPLPKASPDVVFSDVLGLGPIVYPTWGGWIVLLFAAVIGGLAIRRAGRHQPLSLGGVLRGVGAGLAMTLAVVPLADAARRLTGVPFGFVEEKLLLAQFPIYEAALATLALGVLLAGAFGLARGKGRLVFALAPLVAGLVAQMFGVMDWPALGCGLVAAGLVYVSLSRETAPWDAWTGLGVLVFLGALALQVVAPTTGFTMAWPLVAASLTASAIAGTHEARFANLAAVGAALAAGVLMTAQLGYLGHSMVVGVGTILPGAFAPFVLLATLVLFPLSRLFAESRLAPWAVAGVAIAAAALVLYLRIHPAASPRTPTATEVLAVAEPQNDRFWRETPIDPVDPWTRRALKAEGGNIELRVLPALSTEQVRAVAAKPFAYAPVLPVGVCGMGNVVEITYEARKAGSATVVENVPFKAFDTKNAAGFELGSDRAGRRCLTLVVPNASVLRLKLQSTVQVGDVRVDGKSVDLLTKPNAWSHLTFTAPKGSIIISFVPKAHGRIDARWAAFTPGWPKDLKPLPPRPSDVMPWSLSDSTVVVGATGPGDGTF